MRDGKLAIGLPNKTAQIIKDSSGNQIDMNKNNKFEFKMNGNTSSLYVNGKEVSSFGIPPQKGGDSNIKFGLESVPGTLNGTINAEYNNISIQ